MVENARTFSNFLSDYLIIFLKHSCLVIFTQFQCEKSCWWWAAKSKVMHRVVWSWNIRFRGTQFGLVGALLGELFWGFNIGGLSFGAWLGA